MDNLEQKKYPIGTFQWPENISDAEIDLHIETLKKFPQKLKKLLENWTDDMLETQYRSGGWTVRQLVNHLADSHMNSIIRFKLALTEDNPTIKTYEEAKWAELQDSRSEPISSALLILEGLHSRWTHLLKTMTNKEFSRSFYHPELQKSISLRSLLALYAWHCNHHFAHIENLKKEKGW